MADRNIYTAADPVISAGFARSQYAIGGVFSIVAGDLALNATTGLFKAPKGFVLTGIAGSFTDMDSGTALVLAIGDGGDDDRYLTSSTLGQTGGVFNQVRDNGLGYEFTEDTEIFLKATTAAGTAVAGTAKVYFFGYLKS